jgi:hypothetical protein
MPARMLGLLLLAMALAAAQRGPTAIAAEPPPDSTLQRQNMIAGYHFTTGTSELNKAGLNRLQWIVNSARQDRRVVFIEPSTDPRVTAQRIASVKTAIAGLHPAVPVPVHQATRIAAEWTHNDPMMIRDRGKPVPDPRMGPKPTPPAISN